MSGMRDWLDDWGPVLDKIQDMYYPNYICGARSLPKGDVETVVPPSK
jgi:hypothetical protein